ncbi:MAG: GGDEF domain-containing protein [Thermodesulfovibrionales bacterium]
MKRTKKISRLALAVAAWGWLLFVAWLSYDYTIYGKDWIIHILQFAHLREISAFYVLIFVVPFIYTLLGYLINEREILLDKLKESEEKFRQLSLMDDLTGLQNRRGFTLLAEQQLKVAKRTKKGMLLLFADLDRMKWINDNFGHHAGDKALIETAHILRKLIREADILARYGGDEFVAFIYNSAEVTPEILTRRIEESLEGHNREGARDFILSLSIGFAHYDPESPCSLDELLIQADKNMYTDKGEKGLRRGTTPP